MYYKQQVCCESSENLRSEGVVAQDRLGNPVGWVIRGVPMLTGSKVTECQGRPEFSKVPVSPRRSHVFQHHPKYEQFYVVFQIIAR